MSPRRVRLRWAAVPALAALALAAFIYVRYVPKYPQAVYRVDSFTDLSAALEEEQAVRLPPEELLPEGVKSFSVRLVSRVSSAPSGYSVFRTGPDGAQDFALECESLAVLAEKGEGTQGLLPEPIRGDARYRGVPIQVFERGMLTAAAFDYEGQRYSVSMLEGEALEFARALLDAILDG